jgi:hypothetical protein
MQEESESKQMEQVIKQEEFKGSNLPTPINAKLKLVVYYF